MDVDAPEFGTAVERGKDLARVEQAAVVESAFEPLLLGEIGLGEHRRHQVALLHPDAMLAREHAPHFHAELEDLGAECLRSFQFARLVGVVENKRMEIAIAGV